MIKRYSEQKLGMWALLIVACITVIYLAIGFGTWKANSDGYGLLPTYALTVTDSENTHTYVSLIFFVVITLIEGLYFAYFLD